MRAELRRLWSPDVDPVSDYAPEDPKTFGVLVRALVGPSDGEGEESFDFIVCSSCWFDAQGYEKGFAWPRHHLFLERWDYAIVERDQGRSGAGRRRGLALCCREDCAARSPGVRGLPRERSLAAEASRGLSLLSSY